MNDTLEPETSNPARGRLKWDSTDVVLGAWTCGARRAGETTFAPAIMWDLSRYRKADGRTYWSVTARHGGMAPNAPRYYSTHCGLRAALRRFGSVHTFERCLFNGKAHPNFSVVWRRRGESTGAAFARAKAEEAARIARHQARADATAALQERMGADFRTTVTITHDEEGMWTLEVSGPDETHHGRRANRFWAKCPTLESAAEALHNWTRGVIIV